MLEDPVRRKGLWAVETGGWLQWDDLDGFFKLIGYYQDEPVT